MTTIIDRLRRSRALRLLFAVAFVPLVAFTQTGTAQAAVAAAKDSAQHFVVEAKGGKLSSEYTCAGTISFGGHATWSIFEARCDGGVNLSPANTPPEPGAGFTVTVETETGTLCDTRSDKFGKASDSPVWKSTGTLTATGVLNDCAGQPRVVLCVGSDHTPTDRVSGCTTLQLPVLDMNCATNGTASIGQPMGAQPQVVEHGGFTVPRYNWAQRWNFPITTSAASTGAQDKWVAYVVLRGYQSGWQTQPGAGGGSVVVPLDGSTLQRYYAEHLSDGNPSSIDVPIPRGPRTDAGKAPGDAVGPLGEVVGVGIYKHPEGSSNAASREVFGTNATARVGLNDSARCSFYWGGKLWDDGQPGGFDEPAGSVPTAPEPDLPPEDDGDPDESSWWAALWAALKSIISTLVSLPVKIANAILDGISALFVPSGSFLSGQMDRLTGAFSDGALGEWSEVATDIVPPAGSSLGCAGPTVTFEAAGVRINERPLDACSGIRATMAQVSTAFVYGIVGFGGLMASVRALGSGFGWRPGVAES